MPRPASPCPHSGGIDRKERASHRENMAQSMAILASANFCNMFLIYLYTALCVRFPIKKRSVAFERGETPLLTPRLYGKAWLVCNSWLNDGLSRVARVGLPARPRAFSALRWGSAPTSSASKTWAFSRVLTLQLLVELFGSQARGRSG